jgi:hypothetical protein
MVTKDQALTERDFHYGNCSQPVGPRGGVRLYQEKWRRNGGTKTWKTRPEEFRVPIKYGLYGYSYLDQGNAAAFHISADCPLIHLD